MERTSQTKRLLRLLSRGAWIPHLAMRAAGGTRFSARVGEIRSKGVKVEKRWRARQWDYRRA